MGLSVAMAGNAAWASGSIYDWFVALDTGPTVRLCSGPAWTSTTARGSGAGTTELHVFKSLWTNNNSLTCRYSTTSTFTVAVNQGLYVGSMYATANGQTAMVVLPAQVNGGTNNFLGLWNAYNRLEIVAIARDGTASWSYA